DITRHLAGLPILARRETFAYWSLKFFERNRSYVISILTVAVLCLIIGASLALFTTRSKTRESIAILPFINSSQDPDTEYLADGMTDSLIDNLSRFPRLSVPAHNSVFRFKGRSQDLKSIGNALGVATILTGSIEVEGETLLLKTELFDGSNERMIWSRQ